MVAAAVRQVLLREVERRTLVLGLVVLFLNLVDAFATLRHVGHGAEELNPLMGALIARGALWFIAIKHVLASVGVLGIAAHPHARAARIALWVLFPLYTAIAVYQVVLFWLLP